VNWLFEGLGTLLVGIVLGAAGDRFVVTMSRRKSIRQAQSARDYASQVQIGQVGDVRKDTTADRGPGASTSHE